MPGCRDEEMRGCRNAEMPKQRPTVRRGFSLISSSPHLLISSSRTAGAFEGRGDAARRKRSAAKGFAPLPAPRFLLPEIELIVKSEKSEPKARATALARLIPQSPIRNSQFEISRPKFPISTVCIMAS